MPRGPRERIEDKRARLSNDIRRLREASGKYNAKSLSIELGLGHNKVNDYENGVREPSVTTAIRIAKKLGCTVEDLYRPYVERLPKK